MLVPNSLLFRIQSIIHISARFFQSRCGMDLILLVRHLQVIHQIHILYNAHFLLGCRNSAFIFIIEVLWHRISYIIIQVKVTKIRHPGTMRRLMMNKKTEWFTLVPDAVHPIYCQICHNIGSIAFPLYPFTIFNKFRIIIIPLSYQDVPIIKSGRFRYQMPFTDHSSLIAISLKQFRESLLVTVKCGGIIRKSIGMTMFTGQHTGTAGTTQGVCHKTICETDPFIGYPVNIGCLHITLVICTDSLKRMVITHDIHNIHAFFLIPVALFLYLAGRQR